LVITPITSKILPRASWGSIMSKMSVDNENDFSDFDITLNDGLDDL
jgi:antitoxin MazE